MSVEVHFRRFASSLELTNEETRKAATIQNQIREVLEARQDISRAELSGSYDRKTKIRPLHDIDILVVFRSERRIRRQRHNDQAKTVS